MSHLESLAATHPTVVERVSPYGVISLGHARPWYGEAIELDGHYSVDLHGVSPEQLSRILGALAEPDWSARADGTYQSDAPDEACRCQRCGSYRGGYPFGPRDPCLECRDRDARVASSVELPATHHDRDTRSARDIGEAY